VTQPALRGATIDPISVRIPMAVRATGLSRSKIYELIAQGEIETAKVGRATVVFVDSLRKFLDRKRYSPTKQQGVRIEN
jgi:excisionase family DNA binding protein